MRVKYFIINLRLAYAYLTILVIWENGFRVVIMIMSKSLLYETMVIKAVQLL